MAKHFDLSHGRVHVSITETDENGTCAYGWNVFNGKRLLASGTTSAEDLFAASRALYARTPRPSVKMVNSLLAICGQPLRGHHHVPALDLRDGDLLHVDGANYVLVYSAVADINGLIAITAYAGDVPHVHPMRRVAPGALCNLSPDGNNKR